MAIERRHAALGARLALLGLAISCGAPVEEVPAPYFDVVIGCDTFCNIMLRHCRNTARMYPSLQDCHSTCAGFINDPNASRDTGNTLQCRLTYATFASQVGDNLVFCLNAGPAGGTKCRS